MISVRWGGVVRREVPCNRKESETLRDGPFSNFRQSSSEKGAIEKSPSESKQREEKGLSEAVVGVLEGQKDQANQAPEATGARIDGQPIQGDVGDRDEGAEDEANDSGSETAQDPAEDEDEFGLAQEADDEAQPSRWQSDVLCVVDPFIRAKVELASYLQWDTHIYTYLMMRRLVTEPRRAHQTAHHRALSGRLPACRNATPHGRKPPFPLARRPAQSPSLTSAVNASRAKAAAPSRYQYSRWRHGSEPEPAYSRLLSWRRAHDYLSR